MVGVPSSEGVKEAEQSEQRGREGREGEDSKEKGRERERQRVTAAVDQK